MSKVVRGADIILWINDVIYPQVNSAAWDIDWGEQPIYGIDDPFPQEIAPVGRVSVQGSISGLKLRFDGGLQGAQIRSIIGSILSAPYISIRIQDRVVKEDLLYIVDGKVSRERVQVQAKGLVSINFNFIGTKPFQPLDRVTTPKNKNME